MSQHGKATAAPAMPPAMADIKKQSVDEVLAEMNRMPLFMTTLDETDGEGGENMMLEAMKALAYEGTRFEIAENFRQQGNECARAKQWNDAREFYDKAIAALKGPQAKPDPEAEVEGGKIIEVELDEEEEAKKEKVVEEACYVNRALCNLEKMNYRSCINDCASTLRINPSNIKAYYRSGSACLALDKFAEATDACEFGLKLDPTNAPLKALAEKIKKRQDYIAKVEADRRAREEKTASERATLDLAFKARNVTVRTTTDEAPDLEDAKIQLSNPVDPSSPLSYPCLILYPAHSQSDFIKAFNEHQTLPEHLEYIFPLPWDEENEYTVDKVEAYMETAAGGLIKVGKKMALHKVLGSGKVVVSDGLVRISVVPKEKSAAWIEEFKKRKGTTA
ncbi:tetratricopeptide repeat protein 4 [Boeremia exigua]|uniref:tetratricopeptide repeat protein 4 n=1 Tax=Boeremia exigua TaxID=749465 RepID=UPI001E8E4E74|nr:tetratricopeptide repeat protein 4 [Boeremia exigua]KAH6643683.1 tetratricopeptide repeat protein 4 [Boeremia exigua]